MRYLENPRHSVRQFVFPTFAEAKNSFESLVKTGEFILNIFFVEHCVINPEFNAPHGEKAYSIDFVSKAESLESHPPLPIFPLPYFILDTVKNPPPNARID